MSWTRDQARALADRILSFSKAARVRGLAPALARPGTPGSPPTTSRPPAWSGTVRIAITSREGGRSGSTTTDELDDVAAPRGRGAERGPDGRRAARPRAGRGARPAELSRRSPPSTRPRPPPARSTAATASRPALDRARGRGLDASGFFETGARWSAIANKKGNFGFHRSTIADYSTTMRTADGTGSGYAAVRLAEAVGRRRRRPRRARRDQGRVVGEAARPAAGPVHRDPRARGRRRPARCRWLFSLNARSADEGRSFLSKPGGGTRLGEKLFADGVTLRSDPFDPRNPGTPWAGGGGRGGSAAVRRRMRRTAGPQDHLDRERRRQDPRRRPLLGEEDQGRARPVLRQPDPGRLGQVARSPDRRDRAAPCSSPGSGTSAPSTRRTPWSPA